MTLDAQQWALLERLADVTRETDRTSFIRQVAALTRLPAQRRAFIRLIEELLSADQQLADVASSVGTLLRSQVAAGAVTAAFIPETGADEDLEDTFSADDVLRIGRVRGQAEAAILQEPMFEAGAAAAMLGSRARNPREFGRQLRSRGDILALRVGNRFVFPAFQFDAVRHEVRPVVAEINRVLGASDDPWGVASYWFSRDPNLAERPADLAADGARTGELRATAERELAPVG